MITLMITIVIMIELCYRIILVGDSVLCGRCVCQMSLVWFNQGRFGGALWASSLEHDRTWGAPFRSRLVASQVLSKGGCRPYLMGTWSIIRPDYRAG